MNTKKKHSELSLDLIRHRLGSIGLSELEEEKPMSTSKRKGYCSTISAVFPVIEKDIKRFLHAQLMYSSKQAEDWERVIFGRGTFNGIDLLYEHWKQAHLEHLGKLPKEEVEKTSPMPEL